MLIVSTFYRKATTQIKQQLTTGTGTKDQSKARGLSLKSCASKKEYYI